MIVRLALCLFALSMMACEDDALDKGDDGGGAFDAGMTQAADAATGDATSADGNAVDAGNCVDETNSETLDITDPAVSSQVFNGDAINATGDGTFIVVGPSGEMIAGIVPTSVPGGAYTIEIPLFCGDQTVRLAWTNARGCSIERIITVHRMNCTVSDIQVTLTWDMLGLDFELHLIEEGGRINDNATDCTWTSCIGSSPDWGMPGDASDDPHKDVDNTGNYGPENIYLSNAANGKYTVMVEHWGSGSPDADGAVTINIQGRVTQIPIENLAPQFVRTVATIDWPSGTVTTSTVVYNCSNNWSGGCRDPIP